MSLSQKIQDQPYICGVLLSFGSVVVPTAGADVLQNFFDTEITSPEIETIYTTKSKTSFQESSKPSRSGYVYEQRVSISLPIGSIGRSIHIEKVKQTRHVILQLTNGRYLFLGRHDHKHNTAPKMKYSADERIASFQFETQSMFPMGYTQIESLSGFPFLIPVTL